MTKDKLIEITPTHLRCHIAASCPAIFKTEDGKSYVIIGTEINHPDLAGRVGPDEMSIEIPSALIEAALALEVNVEDYP